MTRDRSLDEFLDGDENEAEDAESAATNDEAATSEATTEGSEAATEDSDPDPDPEPVTTDDRSGGATDEELDPVTADGESTEAVGEDPGQATVPDQAAGVTYEWSPGGGTCARCGETVRRRWRTDAGADRETDAADRGGQVAVCADCKDW